MRYDASLKELLSGTPVRLVETLTGSRPVEVLSVEFSSVHVRRPDLVARLEDGRMLHLELAAWIAQQERRPAAAVALMEQAAALEASTPKHPVTPGPTLPATEMLGDLLMLQGKPAPALAAYRRSLALYPRRCNSVAGAVRAARMVGDTVSVRTFYQEGDPQCLSLARNSISTTISR